jgi:N-acetylneuraminic acid mutarotase
MMRVMFMAAVLAAACGSDSGGDDDGAAVDGAAGATDAPPLGDGWASAAAVERGPVQETATVVVDGRIFVLGGFGQNGVLDLVQVYDTAMDAWSDGPELPAALHHANAAVVDGTIYVVGALTGFNFAAIGNVWAFTPGVDTDWRERTAMPAGTQRGGSVVGVVGGEIIVAGGLRGGALTEVSAYDPVEDSWRQDLPQLPAALDHGCGGVVDGTFYITGGRSGAIDSVTDTVLALEGGAWVERAPMPTARGGTACGVVGGRIIVAGGEGNPDAQSGVFPQVESYDPAGNQWTALAPMPTPRHGMGAAAWDGSLYVPGGATTQAFGAVDTHEVLTP